MAISGAIAYEYASNIALRDMLAEALSVTHVFANYAANARGAGRSLSKLKTMATMIADAFAAEGIATIWATITPKASTPSRGGTGSIADGLLTVTLTDPATVDNFALDIMLAVSDATAANIKLRSGSSERARGRGLSYLQRLWRVTEPKHFCRSSRNGPLDIPRFNPGRRELSGLRDVSLGTVQHLASHPPRPYCRSRGSRCALRDFHDCRFAGPAGNAKLLPAFEPLM